MSTAIQTTLAFTLVVTLGPPLSARADLFIAFSQGISLQEASRIPQEIDNASKRKDKAKEGIMIGFPSGPQPRKGDTVSPISLYCPEKKPDAKNRGCDLSVRAPGEVYMTISSPVDRDHVAAKLKEAAGKVAELDAKKAVDRFELQDFLASGDDSLLECEVTVKGSAREWDCSIHLSQDVKRD